MRNIQKVLSYVFVAFLVTLFVGCGSKDTSVPEKLLSKQFKLENISFVFDESRKTEDIVYHTIEELEEMLNENIKTKLDEKGWLSNDINSYTLKLAIKYERIYFTDKMPFFISNDALLFPTFSYKIFVFDNSGKEVRSFGSNKLTIGGILAPFGGFKDKKYEIEFIKAIAQGIIEKIDNF